MIYNRKIPDAPLRFASVYHEYPLAPERTSDPSTTFQAVVFHHQNYQQSKFQCSAGSSPSACNVRLARSSFFPQGFHAGHLRVQSNNGIQHHSILDR